MTPIWTISVNGGTAQTPEALNLRGLRRRLASLDTDTLTCLASVAVDSAPVLAIDDVITLYRESTVWFVGTVTSISSVCTPNAEGMQFVVSGPWDYLDSRVYRQDWAMLGSDGGYEHARTSHVYLGQKVDWTDPDAPVTVYASIADIIDDILDFAEAAGDPIAHSVTNLPADMVVPIIEDRDITCAEAIRRVLRWLPDVIAYWDYSTSPNPTLRFARRANLTAKSFALGAPPLSEFEVSPRYDLQVPCVSIRFERLDQVDGQTLPQHVVDTYPLTATGEESGALVATVDLQGASANTVAAQITAQAVAPANPDWWGSHFATHSSARIISMVIAEWSRTTSAATYPNEIVNGVWYPWMSCLAAQDTIRCRARITYAAEDGGSGQNNVRWEDLSVPVLVTNAAVGTHTYSTVSESKSGEEVPEGLAQRLYDALSTLQYSGRLVLRENECGDDNPTIVNWLPYALSISGSAQSAWSTMAAQVQTVDEEIDTGKTTLTIGPAEHLSPQDLVQLLMITRSRHKYVNAAVQAGGMLTATGTTDITPTPGASGGNSIGQKGWELLTVAKTTSGILTRLALDAGDGSPIIDATIGGTAATGGRQITIDAAVLPAGKRAKMRTVNYCMPAGPKQGEELEMEIVCSNPRDSQGNEYHPITGLLISTPGT